MKAVVVTGASTGIGAACLALLVEKGFLVFASVRKETDAAELVARHGAAVVPLLFDVTDASAVAAAAREVEGRLEGQTLAGLVNNAGVAVPGPLLYLPIEKFLRQIEVNLIGQLQVIQAFAPLLGAGTLRNGPRGRIVNMSSVAGRFAAPFLGAYNASKFALEGMSDALRRELMVYGVDVILI
ncbi:MAG: SDR family NAD(P)-dependent oxidoreductase, partial [Methylocystis sp.]